jgi:hypothetical protein
MIKRTTSLILLILALYASPNLVLADACQNAPAPRLHAGMAAVVAQNVGPLNLRSLPAVDTGVELQLYSGNTVTILSGPSCNGHYNWWRIETANGQRGWVAEGTWLRYWVVPVRDAERELNPLDWSCPPHFSTRWCIVP